MIGAKRVSAPDGTQWRVGRRWLPEKPRLRDRDAGDGGDDGGWLSLDGADFGDAFGIALVVLAVIVVVLLLTSVIFPVLVLTVELLIVIVLFAGGVIGRLLFRKPWAIRARRDGDRHELIWHASGFRRSGRVRDEVAAALARGQTDIRPAEAISAVT